METNSINQLADALSYTAQMEKVERLYKGRWKFRDDGYAKMIWRIGMNSYPVIGARVALPTDHPKVKDGWTGLRIMNLDIAVVENVASWEYKYEVAGLKVEADIERVIEWFKNESNIIR